MNPNNILALISVIAQLCQVSTGVSTKSTIEEVEVKQLSCQKYYVNCVLVSDDLTRCILKRKAEVYESPFAIFGPQKKKEQLLDSLTLM